jgi:uncharacterized Zn finger protein
MVFCPKCFITKEKLSVVVKDKEYKCSSCGEEYPLNATLVSEQTVRTYIAAAPRSTKQIKKALDKLIGV